MTATVEQVNTLSKPMNTSDGQAWRDGADTLLAKASTPPRNVVHGPAPVYVARSDPHGHGRASSVPSSPPIARYHAVADIAKTPWTTSTS